MAIIQTTKLFELKNCWLSPIGEVIVSDDEFDARSFHEDLAYCVIRDLENFANKNDAFLFLQKHFGGYSTEWLEDKGYIRLHGYQVEAIEAKWIFPTDTKITFQQKQKIKSWCRLNEVSWDDAVLYC